MRLPPLTVGQVIKLLQEYDEDAPFGFVFDKGEEEYVVQSIGSVEEVQVEYADSETWLDKEPVLPYNHNNSSVVIVTNELLI